MINLQQELLDFGGAPIQRDGRMSSEQAHAVFAAISSVDMPSNIRDAVFKAILGPSHRNWIVGAVCVEALMAPAQNLSGEERLRRWNLAQALNPRVHDTAEVTEQDVKFIQEAANAVFTTPLITVQLGKILRGEPVFDK